MFKKLIFVIFSLFSITTAIKFNRPRILLPIFDEVRVNFTLQVLEKGCFDFRLSSSSGPPLIQIEPVYDQEFCATKVIITAISKEKTKKTAFVLAENLDTHEVARVDVILDRIHNIGVHTTTRELYLEEAPETFELRAQDDQGNDFSTLEGVEFHWRIENRQQVLRYLTFSESKYHQVPKEIEKFEAMGKRGHLILLDGINSGTAKVIVRLPYVEYKSVPEVQVDIAVLANLIIEPMEATILVGDSIKFKVLQLKQGKLHEIVLDDQYTLEIEKKEISRITGGLANGLKLGVTNVILKDKNVLDNSKTPMPLPKARLTVAEADKILINLLPHYNWVTVEQEKHDIAFDLYTKNDERITLGSKFKITSEFDQSLFKESRRNDNGTRVSGQAVQMGTNKVIGKFNNLIASSDMLIYPKIDLNPKRVILPFDINNLANQKVQFNAVGGDGAFIFSTANPNVLTITQSGIAESHFERVKSQESSTIIVKASLARNIHIFKTAEVLFYPPVKLEIVGYSETALNDFVDLHIGIFAQPDGKEFIPFTSCQNVQFDIEFSSQIFTISSMDYETEKVENACRVVRLKGIHTGTSLVTVAYHHGDEKLKDDAQLVVYEPLITVNPESNVLVLPIGSSRNVIYQHGPRKIYNMGSELTKSLKFSSDIATVKEIQADFQENRFGYEVLCRKVGDTKVTLEIFNSINQRNFIKKSAIVETIVHCVKPRFINLLSLDKLKSSCPIDSKTLLHVKSLQDELEIEIEVLDQQKRKLQNISSLFIDLTFSLSSGVESNKIAFIRDSEVDEIDAVPIPKRDFIRTSISDISTSHKIKAIVKNYEMSILRQLQINPESPVFGISKAGTKDLITPIIENELDLFSFDSSPLPVSSLSVFLSKSVVRLKLRQGSGYYDLKVKDSSILDVKFDKSSSELVITPKKVGETVIEIHDKCLKTENAKLFVSVVTIGRIELLSSDRVEKSKKIEAIARFFDTNDDLIDLDYGNIENYEITEQIANEKILKISMDRQFTGLQLGEVRYTVTGNELGETKIVVSTGGKAVSSAPVSIQVFSPLRLIPRNATIFVGSSLEISYRGGPLKGEDEAASITYSVGNSEILGIDGNVVEGLKLGKTRVVGKCIGVDPKDQSQIVFSEDHIFVTVIPLNKISIRAPLKKIKSDNVMPLTLWAEDVSPMVLGTLKGLRIRWENDSPDVVELQDVFENLGVIYNENDAIAMRLRGMKPGRAKITATVTHGSNMKLRTSIDVVVFKSLELESPKRIVHDPIIIPPKTSTQLKVNLDQTVFEVNDGDFGRNPVLNVSSDGNIQTFDSLGTGLVVATCLNDGQKLDIPIEVKQIHYIMASVNVNVKLREIQSQLPKNLNFPISVSVHDNLGNKFSHNIEDEIKWKLSKKRSSTEIRVGDNSTLSIELLREGSDVLSVSLKDSTGMKYQEDFIKLSIQDDVGVFSRSIQATLGDFICFDSPLNYGLTWESQNPEIIQFQGSVAHVLGMPSNGGSQKVIVRHGLDSGVFAKYEINLHHPDRVQFEKKFDIFNGQLYRGFFTISNHYQANMNKQKALITNNLTACGGLKEDFYVDFFTCQLTSNDGVSRLFATKAVFDRLSGSYACEIHALTTLDEITSLSRSRTISFQLEAQLTSGIYDKIDLKLTPAIQIFPLSFNFERLHQQELVITGMENILQKIELNTSHPDNLVLVPLPKTTSGKLSYKIRLNDPTAVDNELFISIISPLTQQKVSIPILPESHTEKLVSDEKSWIVDIMSNVGKMIAICVLVLTTIALVLMCQRNRELQDTSGVFQTQKQQQQNQTLLNTSGSPNNSFYQPSQQQRISPIKLNSSNQYPESPIYGDASIPSPFRRYHKRAL